MYICRHSATPSCSKLTQLRCSPYRRPSRTVVLKEDRLGVIASTSSSRIFILRGTLKYGRSLPHIAALLFSPLFLARTDELLTGVEEPGPWTSTTALRNISKLADLYSCAQPLGLSRRGILEVTSGFGYPYRSILLDWPSSACLPHCIKSSNVVAIMSNCLRT